MRRSHARKRRPHKRTESPPAQTHARMHAQMSRSMHTLSLSRSALLPPSAFSPSPPRSYKQYHRLLYRGSLSLPDSDLVLEGIILTAHLQPTSSASLLESPLALALESMRGRPSSRLVSIVNVSDVHYECTGDIHPRSVLARSFFENVFCADKVDPSAHCSPHNARSE